METYNHDICGLVRRLDRFAFELHKSVSSGTSQVNQFDQERLAKYLGAAVTYHDWMLSQPQLDLPESHPTLYTIDDDPGLAEVENESINDLLRLIKVTRIELVDSQSSRDPASLNPYDSKRFLALIAKCQAFLDNFIAVVTPLDMPESSPKRATSGPGRTGV